MALDYRVKCCPEGLVTDRRRRIKILDCTIRDGGICNNWQFDREWVRRTFNALQQSGVDYMEIGYRSRESAFDRSKHGEWRFLDEEVLAEVTAAHDGRMKIAAMLDCGKADPSDIKPRGSTVVNTIRIATYAHQLAEARRLLDKALAEGYETFMNVMAVSTLEPAAVDKFLDELRDSGVHNVAIVDSFGALFPYHITHLCHVYQGRLGDRIKIGVHTHNNQQQAFANSIAAIDAGCDFVDATVHGIGRGAGNCPMELLMFYLDNPKYDVRPILEMVDEYATLRDALRWGYHLPYAITGYYNVHPRAGMQRMAREDRYECRAMYESFAGRFGEGGGGD